MKSLGYRVRRARARRVWDKMLEMYLEGHTHKEIQAELPISPKTGGKYSILYIKRRLYFLRKEKEAMKLEL